MSYIIGLFLLVAILYSSVGFGGGSGYLAILSTSTMDHEKMRFIALCCNILVVSFNTSVFVKKKILNLKKTIPLVILSVPLALIGGSISMKSTSFFILLGCTLLLSGILMIYQIITASKQVDIPINKMANNGFINTAIGGIIGFISGLVGIGGGIFLAPILHLKRWDKPTSIAAAASFFILVNSISGLVGQISSGVIYPTTGEVIYPLLAVLLGSIIGVNLTLKWVNTNLIKAMTAILVIVAAIRILAIQMG